MKSYTDYDKSQENITGIILPDEINDLKNKFYKIKDIHDFSNILNFIENRYFKSDDTTTRKVITVNYLYYLSLNKNKKYYSFEVLKKNGSIRDISAPNSDLKRVQKLINFLIQNIFIDKVHFNSNGFIKNRDIKRNAIPHINKRFVYNLDLSNFFPSINFRRIKVVLGLSPFNLVDERELIAFLIANICTYKDQLPQGAPTSPILSNIVSQRLDRRISKLCIKEKVKYSRYADDLTFSSNKNIFNDDFYEKINRIILKENFTLNIKKTRLKRNTDRQQVTGLVVNNKINIKKEFLQKTRAMLNNWEKRGFSYAKKEFKKHHPINKKSTNFKNVLLGNLSFIKNIKGDNNLMINKLFLKYNFLNNQINYNFINNQTVKNKLIEDNIKMEKLILENDIKPDAKFIEFCTLAFYQIENLINYFYTKRFSYFDELLQYLIDNNENFKKNCRNLKRAQNKFKKIKDIHIYYKIHLYEKEFYFDKKIYYEKDITKLRNIRNDSLHRCQIIDKSKEEIIKEFEILKKLKKSKEDYTKNDNEIIKEMETLLFLNQSNYKLVRHLLRNMSKNIKLSLEQKRK